MTKKPVITLLLGACIGLSVATTVQAEQTVRIATNSPYRPMEYTKPDGTLTGFDVDLGNALCKQANLKCTWTNQSWNGIIPGLLVHKYDAIMSSMSITPERAKHVLFSNSYTVLSSKFFLPKNSPIQKIDKATLKGKSIGVQRGTIQDQYATDHFGDIATIKRYSGADDLATDMSTGRVDVALLTDITGQQSLMQPNPGKFQMVGKPLLTKNIGIAFRQNDHSLADKFNKALKTLRDNGTYQRIYKRYFPESSAESGASQ